MPDKRISVISSIVGWSYFTAWSISFYPQIYSNFKRKSVDGLNFDYVALNLMGFSMYSLFNCGFYFSDCIQEEYFERHPHSENPVQLNDVVFSLHATFATIVTIVQCFLYKNENQSMSRLGSGILTWFAVVVLVTAVFAYTERISWFAFLVYCSFIKLAVTIIKGIPQVYMNYMRQSTEGWSIGNIILDFVGGSLSILQMILNAYNYDDWEMFIGDPTKFALGVLSLTFDIYFMLQHFVFYRLKTFNPLSGHEETAAKNRAVENQRSSEIVNQATGGLHRRRKGLKKYSEFDYGDNGI